MRGYDGQAAWWNFSFVPSESKHVFPATGRAFAARDPKANALKDVLVTILY
jgi:hypothetical protein